MSKHRSGPFIVPVRDIVHKPGHERHNNWQALVPETWGEGLVAVQQDEPLDIRARFESVHEGILVSAEIDSAYVGECGRCLGPIREQVEVDFQELFAYSGPEATGWEVQDDHVDLESLVRDAIVLSLPFQPVCKPDCSGLDSITGEPLDAGVGPSIDPRWAALQGFTDTSRPSGRGVSDTHTEES